MAECTHLDQIADVDPQTPKWLHSLPGAGRHLGAPPPLPELRLRGVL